MSRDNERALFGASNVGLRAVVAIFCGIAIMAVIALIKDMFCLQPDSALQFSLYELVYMVAGAALLSVFYFVIFRLGK